MSTLTCVPSPRTTACSSSTRRASSGRGRPTPTPCGTGCGASLPPSRFFSPGQAAALFRGLTPIPGEPQAQPRFTFNYPLMLHHVTGSLHDFKLPLVYGCVSESIQVRRPAGPGPHLQIADESARAGGGAESDTQRSSGIARRLLRCSGRRRLSPGGG